MLLLGYTECFRFHYLYLSFWWTRGACVWRECLHMNVIHTVGGSCPAICSLLVFHWLTFISSNIIQCSAAKVILTILIPSLNSSLASCLRLDPVQTPCPYLQWPCPSAFPSDFISWYTPAHDVCSIPLNNSKVSCSLRQCFFSLHLPYNWNHLLEHLQGASLLMSFKVLWKTDLSSDGFAPHLNLESLL